MPLIKSMSRPAVSQNIKTEITAGRPPKQAVAIAINAMPKAPAPRAPRADKGERRALHPQSHDEFMKLGHPEKY